MLACQLRLQILQLHLLACHTHARVIWRRHQHVQQKTHTNKVNKFQQEMKVIRSREQTY